MKTTHKMALLSALLATPVAQAKSPVTLDQLYELIQQQQAEIQSLKSQLNQTDAKVEATGEALDEALTEAGPSSNSLGSMGAKTKMGGYGELHYNNLDSQTGGSDKNEVDFHRFVLFFSHEFNESIRFFSELELEHALTVDTADGSGPGEVELEQAYVEFDLNDQTSAKGGVFLVPVGILNETHEPNTFYGVERNPIESNIIPSTWWEAGAGLSGRFGSGWSYDAALTSGLNTTAGSNYAVRSGRQKVAKATAKDGAFTARLKWTGMPGVEWAATAHYQQDITHSNDASAGNATLFETHGIVSRGPFTLKALYASWDLDGAGPASVGADEQKGWYLEPSYKINAQFGLFARFNQWDNRAGDSADSEAEQWNAGFNYWPHENVVIKFDYEDQDMPAGSNERDGFNLGIGYQF